MIEKADYVRLNGEDGQTIIAEITDVNLYFSEGVPDKYTQGSLEIDCRDIVVKITDDEIYNI